jgi:hypothetical protein
MVALIGNEVLFVQAVTTNGSLSSVAEQVTTGQIAALSSANPSAYTPVSATATAKIGGKYFLNAATGSTLTLPAATGTGGAVTVVIGTTVTSNSDKILAASSSDSFQGNIITGDGGTATVWNAALSSTYHSLQLNGSTTGGFQGDTFDIRDVATNVWQVTGTSKSTGTAATPFSTATS